MTTEDGQRSASASTGPLSEPTPATSSTESGTPEPARVRTRRAKPQHKSFMRELPGIVITALVISVLIKTFLIQAFYIPSGSMENTLLVNDRVLVNKLADKPDEIHRGDVVVFRDPGGWLNGPGEGSSRGGVVGLIRDGLVFVGLAPAAGEEDLIKRVIGVGGDKVECCDDKGRITVNGVALDEPYLYPGDVPSSEPFGPVTVPEGELWVMGDHRSVSEDSRAHREQPGKGFVPVDDVIGRAFTVVWPLDRTRLLRSPETFQQPELDASGP
jgi:signal peptidase I